MNIRVAVIDDHRLVRAGLIALLRDIPDVVVAAEGADGVAAITIAIETPPDVMLLDLAMPGLSGLDALPELRAHAPDMKIIVLSMHQNEEHVLSALQKGAHGYLIKEAAPDELGNALLTVSTGNRWLSGPISAQVIDGYVGRNTQSDQTSLTIRQREVLSLIADGLSTREIAVRLGVSIKTVETHRQQISARLKIRDVAGLVKYALRHGITRA